MYSPVNGDVIVRCVEKPEFNAYEVIAGFPLLAIRRAISWVGVMDDRDDIKTVADSLGCPYPQAERVLETLERRGFVSRTKAARQWENTQLGHELHRWQPPRRTQPVSERDEDLGEDVCNQVFDEVPCAIFRMGAADSGDTFEEADLEVGVFIEYESPRVIEISISQPDDYDHREESARIESTVHFGVDEAKRFAVALQQAIERAEAEIARRALVDATRKKRRPKARPYADPAAKQAKKDAAAKLAAARAQEKAKAAREARLSRERAELEKTLQELSDGSSLCAPE
jgi:hypothetical protein